MSTKLHLALLVSLLFISFSCFASSNSKPLPCNNHTINSDSVFLTDAPANKSDKILGKIYVNRYNHCGIKRQLAVISDLMKKAAAALGGSKVIAIHLTSQYAIGKIVS